MSTRSVLLVHPDEAKRREVRGWLVGAEVVEVATRDEARQALQRGAPALLLAHHADFKRLLKDLERAAPAAARAVLCPDDAGVRASLAKLVAEGYDFVTVDERSADAVRALVFTRTSARLAPGTPWRARLWLGPDDAHAFDVFEVGSDGLGLRAAGDAPLERFVPGTAVDVEVRTASGAEAVLERRPWLIRTVRREGDLLHLGLATGDHAPASRVALVTDPVRISGWLQRAALQQRRFEVSHVDRPSRVAFSQGRVDEATGELVLAGLLAARRDEGARELRAGDIVNVSFELGRVHTECATVVGLVTDEGVRLRAPRTALQRERRHSLRMYFPGPGASLTFRSPLTGTTSTRRLLDLEPGGAAFSFDAGAEAFPPGLRLEGVELDLDGRPCPCEAIVQSTSSLGEGGTRRCGVRLFAGEGRQALLDALTGYLVPPTRGSEAVPFEQVWQLFVDEKARFPDHPTQSARTLLLLGETQARLASDGGLARSFVYREGDDVLGHAAGLRPYSRTWFSQHLMVRSGFHRAAHVSQELVNLTFDYGEALDDVHYLRGAWGLANRWAARVYGLATPRLVRPGKSYISAFHMLRRNTEPPLAPGPWCARQTREGADFLALVRARLDPVKLAAEDLTADELFLPTIGARYARAGLERTRALAVVGDDAPLGWALLEDMSPGCFWLEYYAATRLYVTDPGGPGAGHVLRALAAFTLERDRRLGRKVTTVIAEPDQLEALLSLGFTDVVGPALEFCAHTSMAREMTSELLNIFERLELRAALRERRSSAALELSEGASTWTT